MLKDLADGRERYTESNTNKQRQKAKATMHVQNCSGVLCTLQFRTRDLDDRLKSETPATNVHADWTCTIGNRENIQYINALHCSVSFNQVFMQFFCLLCIQDGYRLFLYSDRVLLQMVSISACIKAFHAKSANFVFVLLVSAHCLLLFYHCFLLLSAPHLFAMSTKRSVKKSSVAAAIAKPVPVAAAAPVKPQPSPVDPQQVKNSGQLRPTAIRVCNSMYAAIGVVLCRVCVSDLCVCCVEISLLHSLNPLFRATGQVCSTRSLLPSVCCECICILEATIGRGGGYYARHCIEENSSQTAQQTNSNVRRANTRATKSAGCACDSTALLDA